jgi:hypothetical protein
MSKPLTSVPVLANASVIGPAAGALLWSGIEISAILERIWLGPIEVLFLLAPLVLVPLGFRVVQRLVHEYTFVGKVAHALLPFSAVLATASFLLPKGPTAASLAAAWALACALAASDGVWRLIQNGYRSADGICTSASFIYLSVGSVWLVLSRLGATPMHLPEQTVLLAAVHFHFTGFVLPIMAGAALRTLRSHIGGSLLAQVGVPFAVAGIFCGPALLAAGNILAIAALKLIGALLLATVSIGLGALLLRLLPQIAPPAARVLLGISAISLATGMALVSIYAVGEFTERYWLVVPQMARFHGTTNALGFALCGLWGWTLALGSRGQTVEEPGAAIQER